MHCRFAFKEPERVCDRCYDVLKPADLQNALAGHFSRAAQLPVHDVTDWTSMRAWLNNPFSSSLEQDIFKSSTILECAFHPPASPFAQPHAVHHVIHSTSSIALTTCHTSILS
jgi:hypothetical protein